MFYTYQVRMRTAVAFLGMVLLGAAGIVQAGAPQLDTGVQVGLDKPYSSAQPISDVFQNKVIYGKLEGAVPIDIYRFTPSHDGDQTFTLLGPEARSGSTTSSQAVLILVDNTSSSSGEELGLPVPDPSYHTSLIKQADPNRTYTEPALFQDFSLLAQDRVSLKKGSTYYLVVLDPYRQATRYAVKLGDGTAWTTKDVFQNLGSWFRVQTDTYAGSSPFTSSATVWSFLVFIIGLLLLTGMFVIQQIFSWTANRSKAAGYLLVKLQPFSRIAVWVALWFMAIGGYLFFNRMGWTGIPFVLGLLFIPILIAQLYETFRIAPKLMQIEVTKREAAIPLPLRKRLFFSFLVTVISLAAFLVFLAQYLAH